MNQEPDNNQAMTEDISHAERNRAANETRAEGNAAYRAFLHLPDVDPSGDPEELTATFEATYVGSYMSIDEMIGSLTNIGQVKDAIQRFAADGIDTDFITIDYQKLVDAMMERWNILLVDNFIYVFEK